MPKRDTLWSHRGFRLLWAGDTAGQFATFTGVTVLPLLAATVLLASPFEMGLLTAAESTAFLLLGLPAGVWVDRLRRKPLMVRAAFTRAVLLLSVPVAWWLDLLALPQLIVVGLLMGVATVFFDIAYQSYLPFLVGRKHLLEGNAKLQASQSVAQISGPGAAGGLTQLAGAANSVLLTGFGFLAAGTAIWRIREVEPPSTRAPDANLRREVIEGLRFVFGNRSLRAIVCCTGTANFFNGAFNAVEVLFLVRHLTLSPAQVGLVLALGGAGGVVGALTARPLLGRIGQARAIWLVPLLTWPFQLLIPLATPESTWTAPAGMMVFGFGVVIYNVAQVSFRQAVCPDRLLGRMNASVRWVVWGALPLGGLTGGLLGEHIGVPATISVVVCGELLAFLWVLCSPLRTMRDLPQSPVPAT